MKTLRFVHRWLGLVLALPLLVQGLTGLLLTLEPVWPGGTTVAAAGPDASANAILAAARQLQPDGTRIARYIPAEGTSPAEVVFITGTGFRGPGHRVQIDPASLQPLGPLQPTGSGVMNWVKQLHDNLLLPQYGGRQVAGWFGVGLLLLTLIGIPLWWPRPAGSAAAWRAAVTVPRRARGARLQRALHGAVAGWMVAMLLATSITGILQGFPQTSRALLGLPAGGPGGPPRPAPEGQRPEGQRPDGPRAGGPRGEGARADAAGRPHPQQPAPPPDIDAAIRLARAALPGTEPHTVMLPATPQEPIRLMMAPPGTEGAIVTRIVTVDARATQVLSAQTPGLPANEMVMRWAHDLHEGAGLGPVWRGLTVLVGLALPALGGTGWALWLLKRRNRRRVRMAAMSAAAE